MRRYVGRSAFLPRDEILQYVHFPHDQSSSKMGQVEQVVERAWWFPLWELGWWWFEGDWLSPEIKPARSSRTKTKVGRQNPADPKLTPLSSPELDHFYWKDEHFTSREVCRVETTTFTIFGSSSWAPRYFEIQSVIVRGKPFTPLDQTTCLHNTISSFFCLVLLDSSYSVCDQVNKNWFRYLYKNRSCSIAVAGKMGPITITITVKRQYPPK